MEAVIRPSLTGLGDVGATKFLDREQLKVAASDIDMAGQAMDRLRLIHLGEQIVAFILLHMMTRVVRVVSRSIIVNATEDEVRKEEP